MKWIEKDLGNMEKAEIVPLSDLHIGDKHFSEDKCLKTIDYIKKQKNCYCILVGDLLNCATKNSVSDSYSEQMNPQQAKKYAIAILEPIKDKILGSVFGNHENNRIWKDSGIDVCEDIADKLDIPYAAEGMFLNIRVGNAGPNPNWYSIYATHGAGGGRTIGGKANMLKRASEIVISDIYVTAHTHQIQTFSDYIFMPDVSHKKIVQKKRLYVNCGSFLDYGGYAETHMYPVAKTGVPKIILSGTRKDFHASI